MYIDKTERILNSEKILIYNINSRHIEWRDKMSSKDYQNNLKNLKGTFAVEDMNLSKEIIDNIEKIADDEMEYSEIVETMKRKYMGN